MTADCYFADTTRVQAGRFPAPTFRLGDRVYALTIYQRDATVACDVCAGQGLVSVQGTDNKAHCPERDCRRGQRTVTRDQRFYSIRPLTIRQVSVTLEDEVWSRDAGRLAKRTVRYMAEETGVGSGQNWPEGRLFADREDAVRRAMAHDAANDGGWYLREDERARWGR